jgi:hypothetical protein
MNRLQLEHIIRAAGSIADDDEIVVLGSSSIFAQFPDIPDEFVPSVEADIFPKNKTYRSDTIDGSIGELSPFHESFGYYAHGVSRETAGNLPQGWDNRLIPISSENTGGVTGWCVEIHDLVAGKYASGREKDLEFNTLVIRHGVIKQDTLCKRVEELQIDEGLKRKIRQRLKADFERTKTGEI